MSARNGFLCWLVAAVLGTAAAQAFDTPLYINMGGPQVVDSIGRTWLGDEGAGLDPLGIRPDDAGGFNVIPNWCAPSAASIAALGFDPANPADVAIFQSIRWDEGAAGPAYLLEIPVAAGSYTVSLYFCESCCTFRHEKVEIQGEIKFSDVSAGSYAGGATHTPGVATAENIIVGDDGILRIKLLPCLDPECPGGTDANPILTALAVVPTGFDPCSQPGFRACPGGLKCTIDPAGNVAGTWSPPSCIVLTGYTVFQDGAIIASLPPEATSFSATQTQRVSRYVVVANSAEGEATCPAFECTTLRPDVAFEVPLRINMGGPRIVDTLGREWLGDGSGTSDPLDIRTNDLGGANTVPNWCPFQTVVEADAFRALGFDPDDASDRTLINDIRWDLADDVAPGGVAGDPSDNIDFFLEIPVPNGSYLVNFYFIECCCLQRHFKISLEGQMMMEDVNSTEYLAAQRLGRGGRLSFDAISVTDGSLSIGLLPCFECLCPECVPPVVMDNNAAVSALEVLPAATTVGTCPQDLVCTPLETGEVTLTWTAPVDAGITGYEILRDGLKIGEAAAGATTFVDERPLCRRAMVYEVVPLFAGASPCPSLNLMNVVTQLECPFVAPVRINAGGVRVTDSLGRIWLGDQGAGLDPLGIRPDDTGGSNVVENWSNGVFQPDSFAPFGLDPTHPADVYIFNTIRWDNSADLTSFLMELPLQTGVYTVNLYFNESTSPGRHWQLEVEGAMIDSDVSIVDYSPANPVPGRLGVIAASSVSVADGALQVNLTGCPALTCPGSTDANPILDALEIIAESTVNTAPTASIQVTPAGDITLSGGKAQASLDGRASGDGDQWSQGLTYAWTKASGPAGDTISAPSAAATVVEFTAPGTYKYRLVVDDGQAQDNTAQAEVDIVILPEGIFFVRGDSNSDGKVDLTDGVVTLSFLFLGQAPPKCMDSADADDTGKLDITDGIYIFNWLFIGGPKPKTPSPSVAAGYVKEDCGLDPSGDADGLECAEPAAVCK